MKALTAKEYRWEMGHRIPFHNGPCKNVHGHSYKLIIELIGTLDKKSMIIDFYELDKIVMPLINKLDHCFLCDEKDKTMIDFLKKNGFKYSVITNVTTVENISTMMINELTPEIKKFKNISRINIRLFETANSYSEISSDL